MNVNVDKQKVLLLCPGLIFYCSFIHRGMIPKYCQIQRRGQRQVCLNASIELSCYIADSLCYCL